MTRRNSEADSIVWIEEGKRQDRVVSVRIHAPKTILVFGIFSAMVSASESALSSFCAPWLILVRRIFV